MNNSANTGIFSFLLPGTPNFDGNAVAFLTFQIPFVCRILKSIIALMEVQSATTIGSFHCPAQQLLGVALHLE